MEFFDSLEFWHWLVLGLLLIVAEIFVFGAVLIWLGVAAIIVGIVAFLLPLMLWPAMVLTWAALSIGLIVVWQFYRKRNPAKDNAPTINRRGQQIVGRHFTLNKDIVNGIGELNVDDTRWKVVSHHDLTAGTKVKVLSVDGTSLRVEEYIS